AVVVWFIFKRGREWPVGKPCSICGATAGFGYDRYAEDLENIKPMCLTCLTAQLEKEYVDFTGRAVVIQPAEGPPSYVFQPVKEWKENFKNSKIADDVIALLQNLAPKCRDCDRKANFLWVESNGLNGDNFS